ncbi:MAG: hypothetical protein ACI9TY_000147 [Alphaproteobacteria bacterium]
MGSFVGVKQKNDADISLNEGSNATYNVDSTMTQEVEGAQFNLDKDNPEIIMQDKGVDYELISLELQDGLNEFVQSNMSLESIYEMTSEQRQEVVHKIASDFRACETAIDQYGSIDAEYVGENNMCSRYFNENLEPTMENKELHQLANPVMHEDYAKLYGGIAENEYQQEVQEHLGEDFSAAYKARQNIMKDANSVLTDIRQGVAMEVGDLSHLSSIISKDSSELSESELSEIQAAADQIKQASQNFVDNYTDDLDNNASDLEHTVKSYYVHNMVTTLDQQYANGHLMALNDYIEEYEENMNPQEVGEVQYDNAYDFARGVRESAQFYGVSDKVNMSFNLESEELTITQATIDMDEREL